MIKKIYTIVLSILFVFNKAPTKSENMNNTISQTSIVGSLTKSDAYNNYKSFFNYVDDSFVIPGLTTNMCPQGLCKAEEYVLITAYDPYIKNESCIYVIDINTGKYEKTVRIKNNKTHVGGITFNGEYVYVANSINSSLSKILFDDIVKAKDNSAINWELIDIKKSNNANIRASFCTYDNIRDIVWVGIFDPFTSNYAYGYSIDNTNAKLTHIIKIPKYTQGLIFDNDYVYFSTSSGSYTSSKIYKCNYTKDYNKGEIDYYSYDNIEVILAPPGSENIFIYNKHLYVLFENAANCYYQGVKKIGFIPAFDPVDSVCIYNM